MKAIWAALKDTVLSFIIKINFTDLIMGAVTGFTGFWGKLLGFILKPFLSKIEERVDKSISEYETTEKSDADIDQSKATHEDQISKAKTDEEVDEAFRDSLR